MAFIGNNLGSITTEARTVDTMVGDGSTATLTLTKTPGSVNNVEVFYDGIFQTPGVDFTLAGNIITFTTAPTTGINVRAFSGDDSQVVFPDANSITTKKILDNTITSDKIVSVAVEKLSGTLPAVDGSAVTGMNLPDVVDLTTSASNPTRTMNKPVGSLAVNSTSGEMFICTDNETDNNTWMNVGLGTDDVVFYLFQGTQFGYVVGGGPGSPNISVMDKYSYTSQQNSSNIGNLVNGGGRQSGHKSTTHGWACGGNNGGSTIEKYSFVTGGDAVDSGISLSTARIFGAGSSSATHGYSAGGQAGSSYVSNIDKFSFSSSSGTASDHGSLGGSAATRAAAHSSTTHGYYAGGSDVGVNSYSAVVHKYSFDTGVLSASVGTLVQPRTPDGGGASSSTDAYTYCGYGPNLGANNYDGMDKMSFSSEGQAVNIGSAAVSVRHPVASCSITDGYIASGYPEPYTGGGNYIQKHSFSSNGNFVDWADLTAGRFQGIGSQY